MTTRKILTLAILPLFLVGCLDSDDDNGSSLNDEDRARAAASASVITGSLDSPDDDDDSGSGGTPLSVMRGANPMQMEPCAVSGTTTSGGGLEDVGSPYTASGEVDISWNEYDNCVQGVSGSEYEFDGYSASGTAESGNVSYSGWSSARGAGVGLSNRFVLDWPEGTWSFAGELHNCSNCSMGGLFASEAFLEWEIAAQGETVTFNYGEPGNPFTVSGDGQQGGQVQQTLEGNIGLEWAGTPCEFDVTYETVSPLVIDNYGTTSEVLASGELNLTLSGGSTYNVTYDNGDIYLDGQLVDPDEPNPCDGAFDVLNTSI